MESTFGTADLLYLALSLSLAGVLAYLLACAGRRTLPASGYLWGETDSAILTVLAGFGLVCLGFIGFTLRIYVAMPEPENLLGALLVRLSVLALFLGVAYMLSLTVMGSMTGSWRTQQQVVRHRPSEEDEPED